MRNRKSFKIGWISDIHYRSEYDAHPQMDKYFEAISMLFKKNKVNYLAITGDLAFSGLIEEFSAFKKQLEKHFNSFTILTIPGNHEVHWPTYQGLLKDPDWDQLGATSQRIATNQKNYREVFAPYKQFHQQINPKNHVFSDDLAHGYWHDTDNNVLFLQLNSAWLSFGDEIIYAAFQKTLANFKLKFGETHLTEFRKKYGGDALSQASMQSYFLNLFEYWAPITKIIEEVDPTVVTLVHHGPFSLNWKEQHGDTESLIKLEDLIEKSHLMLTGHLHLPYIQSNILEDTCIHLTTGCTLDYHKVSPTKDLKSNFDGSVLGILDVSNSHVDVQTYRFSVKNKSIEWDEVQERRKQISFRLPITSTTKGTVPEIIHVSGQTNGTISSLLFEHRKYLLGFDPKLEKNPIEKNKWYKYTLDHEVFIVAISSLPEYSNLDEYNAAYKTSKWPFGALLEELENPELKGKNVVVCFLDVIQKYPNLDDETLQKWTHTFHKFYFRQQLSFQRFKISFFNQKKLVDKHMDIPITYDCILV